MLVIYLFVAGVFKVNHLVTGHESYDTLFIFSHIGSQNTFISMTKALSMMNRMASKPQLSMQVLSSPAIELTCREKNPTKTAYKKNKTLKV